jgi:hypothetical protein
MLVEGKCWIGWDCAGGSKGEMWYIGAEKWLFHHLEGAAVP